MGSEAKWIEGWFTKPGWFWCVTTSGKLEVAKVLRAANALACITSGGFRFEGEVTHWLDAEIVPPAQPEQQPKRSE